MFIIVCLVKEKKQYEKNQTVAQSNQLQALRSSPHPRTCTDDIHDRARVLPRSVARRVFFLNCRPALVGESALRDYERSNHPPAVLFHRQGEGR